MATGIRPSSSRPAILTNRSQSGINVRSAPSVQNVVVSKTPVRTYNPAAGAGQVGSQIASRINQMGQTVDQFFNMQTQNIRNLASIELRNELVKIDQKNLDQRREAMVDEAKDPGGAITKYPQDRDYYETRLQVRASLAGGRDATNFINNVLPNLPLVDEDNQPVNPTEALSQHLIENTEGMDNAYAAFYTDTFLKQTKQAMETHLTERHNQQKINAQLELGERITTEIQSLGISAITRENIDRYVSDARVLYDRVTHSDGQVKSLVIKQIVSALKQKDPPDDTGLTSFLSQLENNPKLGDGEKTFQQLFPNEYEDIAQTANDTINESWKHKGDVVVQHIDDVSLGLNDPQKSYADKQQLIQDTFLYLA